MYKKKKIKSNIARIKKREVIKSNLDKTLSCGQMRKVARSVTLVG